MQVALERQDGCDVRPFRRSRRTSHGLRPPSFLVLRHEIPEGPPSERLTSKALLQILPSISDEALLVASGTWRHLGGRGTPQGLSVVASVFPERVLRVIARTTCLAPSLPPPWRKSPCRWSCDDTDGVRVFTVDDGWGCDIQPSSIGTGVRRLACVQARRPLRRSAFSGSPWGATYRPPPVRPAAAQYGVQERSIKPSYAFVEQPQTNGVAERFFKEQSMAASTATSRSCGTPSAGSSNSTMPSGSWR